MTTVNEIYATLYELKARLGIPASDTADDTILSGVLAAVSRFVDDFCGRRFYTTGEDETRYYMARSRAELLPDDIVSVTSLATDDDGDRTFETTWAATDYDLAPYNAALDGQPYTAIDVAPSGDYTFPVGVARGVKVVGKFGYGASLPKPVIEATLLQASRLYMRKNAPFGVMGAGDAGQAVIINRLDPDVRVLLSPYRRGLEGA